VLNRKVLPRCFRTKTTWEDIVSLLKPTVSTSPLPAAHFNRLCNLFPVRCSNRSECTGDGRKSRETLRPSFFVRNLETSARSGCRRTSCVANHTSGSAHCVVNSDWTGSHSPMSLLLLPVLLLTVLLLTVQLLTVLQVTELLLPVLLLTVMQLTRPLIILMSVSRVS
jgi:hypothetical protein